MADRNNFALYERDLESAKQINSHTTLRSPHNDESNDTASPNIKMDLLTLVLLSHIVSSIVRLVTTPTSNRFR